jgi:cell division protein FtsN
MRREQGGTLLGFIIGLMVGLGIALAVAVYVTKVPIPFMNKGQSRSADQDEAEARKNKDWDPNAPLYGKNPSKTTPTNATPGAPETPASAASAPKTESKPSGKDIAGKADSKADGKADPKPAVSADPLGDLAKAKSGAADGEPFLYFVQVGAYKTMEDAEAQRAKLSLSGIETKISEREQSGRTVFRVRVGPFEKKEDGEKSKNKLDEAGLETSLVRVQR